MLVAAKEKLNCSRLAPKSGLTWLVILASQIKLPSKLCLVKSLLGFTVLELRPFLPLEARRTCGRKELLRTAHLSENQGHP